MLLKKSPHTARSTEAFQIFLVEQVHNHYNLIKVTFKKLLKAGNIKLSGEEAACIALVWEELLSKAKNTSVTQKSKSQIGIGDCNILALSVCQCLF